MTWGRVGQKYLFQLSVTCDIIFMLGIALLDDKIMYCYLPKEGFPSKGYSQKQSLSDHRRRSFPREFKMNLEKTQLKE